jgi:hypothetical protein
LLDEHWTTLDGVEVFSRESRRPTDGPVMLHLHGFGMSGAYLVPTMCAVDVCVEAVRSADATVPDGGLRWLVTALVPVGPQLSFLWRAPRAWRPGWTWPTGWSTRC